MPDYLPLFDSPKQRETNAFPRQKLAGALRALAARDILVGCSSWKYEGWLRQIYSPERYMTRGRFSRKKFEELCLAEYAEIFPIVCGDFSFYQFPAPEFWQKLFVPAPKNLRFAFKAPEEITVKVFPQHPRYGPRAGQENPAFLDPALFRNSFAGLLRPWKDRVAVLIFEFGAFPKAVYPEAASFARDLDWFLEHLPPDFRYAVEVRNQEFLAAEYFGVLRRHGVAHVFSAWTRMPPMGVQISIPEAFTADFTVARALLRAGRPYERAVAMFSPYAETKDANPETRTALRDLIERAKRRREPAYLFINNRLEGNAPITIQSIVAGDSDS